MEFKLSIWWKIISVAKQKQINGWEKQIFDIFYGLS